jgi:ubiquinone/menaquinone biosynthesis C-methylase UbiE
VNFWERVILPRIIDRLLGTEAVAEERRATVAGVAGRVLEIGFGSGLNLPWYDGAKIDELVALDPSTSAFAIGKKRLAATNYPVTFLALSGEAIAADTASFDVVVSTFTLCTIPDVDRALVEIRRVLKPAGRLHFLEHGRSSRPNLARWQTRLTPIQKAVGGGCHLDRDITQILDRAGFDTRATERYEVPNMGLIAPRYRGVASVT